MHIQVYARLAGVLILISMVSGGFGEAYVPSRLIVPDDAGATAQNIDAFESLFRLGFASYLVEAICDLTLAILFYALLKPVNPHIALLAAFFGILGTALFAAGQLFYFAAPKLILGGAAYLKVFSPEQLDALALLSLKFSGFSGGIASGFYGIAWILRGSLMMLSGYLPKLIGLLMAIGGLGFAARTFALVLAPEYASQGLLMLLIPGAVLLTLWLLIMGVNVPRWQAKAAEAEM